MPPAKTHRTLRKDLLNLPTLSPLLARLAGDADALRSFGITQNLTSGEACLAANICRLKGAPDEADALLQLANPVTKLQTAIYLRCLALIRWDQGRCDETIGLLIRARLLFSQSSQQDEANSVDELLVLAHAEVGEVSRAIDLFSSLSEPLRGIGTGRPWLTSQMAFTVAFCLAKQDVDLAHHALDLGRSCLPLVQESDRLLLEWLEQRARARMGQDTDAVLTALREGALSSSAFFHAFLLTIDLFAVRKVQGRDMDGLIQEIKKLPAVPERLPGFLLYTFHLFVDFDDYDPWEAARELRCLTSRLFKSSHFPTPPIPFT